MHLDSVGICLQKAQYDNLQRLVELTNDYMGYCNTEALKLKKIAMKELQKIIIEEKRTTDGVVKKTLIRKIFQ